MKTTQQHPTHSARILANRTGRHTRHETCRRLLNELNKARVAIAAPYALDPVAFLAEGKDMAQEWASVDWAGHPFTAPESDGGAAVTPHEAQELLGWAR
jgi:hypothetical protein